LTNLAPKVESMTKLRPDLNGSSFFYCNVRNFYCRTNFLCNKKI